MNSHSGDYIFPTLNSPPALGEHQLLLSLQALRGRTANAPWQYPAPDEALRHLFFTQPNVKHQTPLALQEGVTIYKLQAQLVKYCKVAQILREMLIRKPLSFPCWEWSGTSLQEG